MRRASWIPAQASWQPPQAWGCAWPIRRNAAWTKGGAFANVEAKNLETGNKLNERFRSEDKVERVTLEQRDYSYLFDNGETLVFMDDESYEQIELQKGWVGEDRIPYLQEGMKVVIESHEDRPIGLELPEQVVLEVVETEPTVKGQTASSSYKPAKASNGIRVMIPPFMSTGEKIVVDTSTGEYVRRAD
ncbi:MAG: elongation factor P [Brevundimonas diminuta]|nr:elongation factor P [Brevundimonas diminuta]